MGYSQREIEQFIGEEDVKFIRLAFSDVRGNQKNISVMPGELERAFHYGIAFDASSVDGFGGEVRSDLFLHPDLSTLSILPWRPDHGRVVRMYCDIKKPDGTPSEADTRRLLKDTVRQAEASGLEFRFGSEMEFYLLMLDQDGRRGEIPHDEAGYMDISPEDKGENVRREICLTLEQMGIVPESSHHEAGPGQNEIDFRCSDPVSAADNAVTFRRGQYDSGAERTVRGLFSQTDAELSRKRNAYKYFCTSARNERRNPRRGGADDSGNYGADFRHDGFFEPHGGLL